MQHKVHLATITHPDDVEYVENEVYRALRDKNTYHLKYRFIHKNGSIINIQESGEAVTDAITGELYIEGMIQLM